jgi:hypothetical protein
VTFLDVAQAEPATKMGLTAAGWFRMENPIQMDVASGKRLHNELENHHFIAG